MKNNYLLLIISIFILSCKKEEQPVLSGFAKEGTAIVTCEGSFGANNGSLSFVDGSIATNNIFESANSGLVVGDVVQHYCRVGNRGIIVVNNSQKIMIVEAETFKLLKTLTTGFDYPRYAVAIDDERAYVTNGSGTGKVLVVNVSTLEVEKEIAIGKGPEMLLKKDKYVFICNSGGFNNDDNTVSVIDTETGSEIRKINVGDVPVDMDFDATGHLWVLCKGIPDYSNFPNVLRATEAKLVKINTATQTVAKEFTVLPVGSIDDLGRLAASKDRNTIFYTSGKGIYAMPINSNSLPLLPIIPQYFYGIDTDPQTGLLWCTQGNFSSNGYVKRFNTNGIVQDSVKVGIGPNNSIFN
ncbi:MAG: hypothetical protein K1X55_17000 [Chitinophagales bacterium]|nr:hypothetical protein [Chitinophagales bacterium]